MIEENWTPKFSVGEEVYVGCFGRPYIRKGTIEKINLKDKDYCITGHRIENAFGLWAYEYEMFRTPEELVAYYTEELQSELATLRTETPSADI